MKRITESYYVSIMLFTTICHIFDLLRKLVHGQQFRIKLINQIRLSINACAIEN